MIVTYFLCVCRPARVGPGVCLFFFCFVFCWMSSAFGCGLCFVWFGFFLFFDFRWRERGMHGWVRSIEGGVLRRSN